MSRRKDDEDEAQENLMILRLPEKYAQTVRQAVNKGNLRERLQVDIKDDCRNALLKIENDILSAKIVDLPCIVECKKTVDKKTFYKTGDICQMLLVNETPLESTEASRNQQVRKERNDYKKLVYLHGVTPPFKNVRRKRFRKTAPKKIIDDPEVEKEVRRLLRADISAISVQTRIVYDKAPITTDNKSTTAGSSTTTCDLSKVFDDTISSNVQSSKINSMEADQDKSFDKELMEMFQDLSSDDGNSSEDEDTLLLADKTVEDSKLGLIPNTQSNTTSQDALYEQETFERKIRGLEVEIARTSNSFLKKRLQDDMENLKKARSKK